MDENRSLAVPVSTVYSAEKPDWIHPRREILPELSADSLSYRNEGFPDPFVPPSTERQLRWSAAPEAFRYGAEERCAGGNFGYRHAAHWHRSAVKV